MIGHDLYDSELLAIEDVKATLTARSAGRRDYADFEKEIIDRFREAGFKVSVNWYTFADYSGREVEGAFLPDVTIEDRLGPAFDPDQMVHEVTHDLLELGEGGVIDTTRTAEAHKAAMDAHEGHRHGG